MVRIRGPSASNLQFEFATVELPYQNTSSEFNFDASVGEYCVLTGEIFFRITSSGCPPRGGQMPVTISTKQVSSEKIRFCPDSQGGPRPHTFLGIEISAST